MALNVPVFLTRLGSSVVFVAIMLTGLLWNQWAFLGLVCLINFLCLREYFKLMQKIDTAAYWPKWLPIVTQISAINILLLIVDDFYFWPGGQPEIYNHILRCIPLILLSVVPALSILACVLSKKMSFQAMVQSIGGLFYITLPMFFLLAIYVELRGSYVLLMLIVMIWSNDTMAYLVGSFFGKHPFSPISPKKTWEGTIGGALITIVAAGIVGYFSHQFRIIDWMALALCATVAGTFGDLLESKLKRLANVKDSGNLMPGHGGALDRFDSLLIATPFAFVYVMVFMR